MSATNETLLVKFEAIPTGTKENGKVDYKLKYEVHGDDAGLMDMLIDVFTQNKAFATMCQEAIFYAAAGKNNFED